MKTDIRRRALSRLIPALWGKLGLNRLMSRLNRGRKRVVTYHNVIPDKHFADVLHLGVSHKESVFRSHMLHLKRHYRTGVALGDGDEILITFDDGYLNQYEVAHIILSEFSMKACFFCCLDLAEGKGPLLTDELLCWLSYVPAGTYRLPPSAGGTSEEAQMRSEEDRARLWRQMFVSVRQTRAGGREARAALDSIRRFEDIHGAMGEPLRRLRLEGIPEKSLKRMAEYGHIVGAHSRSHDALRYLSSAELAEDIEACAARVGSTFSMGIFSYPFGGTEDVSSESVRQVRASGFRLAMANINHPIRSTSGLRYGAHFYPRMSLPNVGCSTILDFHLSGSYHFLKYRRLLPRVPISG